MAFYQNDRHPEYLVGGKAGRWYVYDKIGWEAVSGPHRTRKQAFASIEAQSKRTCEWFALCTNEQTHEIEHPVLGSVGACKSCADKYTRLGGSQDSVTEVSA